MSECLDLEKAAGYLLGHSPPCSVVDTSQPSSKTVSELLIRRRAGDQQALETLVPLVHRELRDIAHYHLQRERHAYTLQAQLLVHGAHLRLVDQKRSMRLFSVKSEAQNYSRWTRRSIGFSRIDKQQGHIAEMRFLGGFSIEEIGEVLGVSCSMVTRECGQGLVFQAGEPR